MLAPDSDDSAWLVPGFVLAGWGGVAQLGLFAVGGWVLVQMYASLFDDGTKARPKLAKRHRRKRWEHVPSDTDTAATAAEPEGPADAAPEV